MVVPLVSHAVQVTGSRRSCTVAQGMCWFWRSPWNGTKAVSAFITTQVCVIKSETFRWEKENTSSVNFPWLCWGSDSCLQEVFVQGAVHSSLESSPEYSPSLPLFPSHPREFSLLTRHGVCSGFQRLFPFFPKLCFLLFSQVVL